jgi:hypothetical protein
MDDQLQHLSGLINLQTLNLDFNYNITCARLRHHKGLINLQTLTLYGTNVTYHLYALINLKTLYLRGVPGIRMGYGNN